MEMIKNPDPEKTSEVVRTPNGYLFVNVKRSDFSTCRMAAGAGLNRLLRSIGSITDFMLITSFRGYEASDHGTQIPRTKIHNERLFQKLPAHLRAKLNTKRIGAYWLVGHWTECPLRQCIGVDGQVIDSVEYSWFFSCEEGAVTHDAWLHAGIELATKHGQDGFIIRVNGDTTLRNQDGEVLTQLATNSAVEDTWARLARLRGNGDDSWSFESWAVPDVTQQKPAVFPQAIQAEESANKDSAYHLVGTGKPYAPGFFIVEPHNNSGKMIFATMGIEYRV